jgi:hypothetical protein
VPLLAGLEHAVLEVDRDVFSDTRSSPARRISYLERQVPDVWAVVDDLADSLQRLVRDPASWLNTGAREQLHETAEHVDRITQRARNLTWASAWHPELM